MTNKHEERCFISLTIKELLIKTTMRYYYTPVRMCEIKKANNIKCQRRCGAT